MKKFYLYLSFLFTMISTSISATTIDLMALYTKSVEESTKGEVAAQIEHYIEIANNAFKRSGLNLTVRLVHLRKTSYPEPTDVRQALNDITYHKADFANVEYLRDIYGADAVVLFSTYRKEHGNVCGVAFKTSHKSRTYSYVSVGFDCPNYVLAHELGHNMELEHSERQSQADKITPQHADGQGHGVDGEFVTIMAYSSAFGGAKQSYRFSNPNKYCYGFPCGVVGISNAVRVMKKTSKRISEHYPTKVVAYEHISDTSKSDQLLHTQARLVKKQTERAKRKRERTFAESSKRVKQAEKDYQTSRSEYTYALEYSRRLTRKYNAIKQETSLCFDSKKKQKSNTRIAANKLRNSYYWSPQSNYSYLNQHRQRISYRKAKKDLHSLEPRCNNLLEEQRDAKYNLQQASRDKFNKGQRLKSARRAYEKERARHARLEIVQ